jgi:hypothetical protein
MNRPSPLPERFYLGGDFSPVCTLGGPMTLWGFRTRGLGPAEPQRQSRDVFNDEVMIPLDGTLLEEILLLQFLQTSLMIFQ